jgi:hypothetical protein
MTYLKALRLSRGETQSSLERKSKIKKWKISLAESGRLKLPDTDLQRLAKALGADSCHLLKDINF